MTVEEMKEYIPAMKRYLRELYMKGNISESIMRYKAVLDLEKDFNRIQSQCHVESDKLIFADDSEESDFENTYQSLLWNGYIEKQNKPCTIIKL